MAERLDTMVDTTPEEHVELTPTEARAGFRGRDMLAVLAVSTFLAAVGLTTFFLTTSFAG
jgi:hypothetical protein